MKDRLAGQGASAPEDGLSSSIPSSGVKTETERARASPAVPRVGAVKTVPLVVDPHHHEELVSLARQGAYVLLLDRDTGEPICEPTRDPIEIAQVWNANRRYHPRPALAATKRSAAVAPPNGIESWWPPTGWRPGIPVIAKSPGTQPTPAISTHATPQPDIKEKQRPTRQAALNIRTPPTPRGYPTQAELRRLLDQDERGRIVGNDKNAILVLRNIPEWQMLRYNERTARFEIGAEPPVPPEFLVGGTYPRELCDEDFTSVRVALLESGWGNYSTQVASRALRLVAKQRSYDPVRSYLADLSWDGTPRLPVCQREAVQPSLW